MEASTLLLFANSLPAPTSGPDPEPEATAFLSKWHQSTTSGASGLLSTHGSPFPLLRATRPFLGGVGGEGAAPPSAKAEQQLGWGAAGKGAEASEFKGYNPES